MPLFSYVGIFVLLCPIGHAQDKTPIRKQSDRIIGLGRPSPTKLDCGIEIHANGKTISLPNVSGNGYCACMAAASIGEKLPREIAIVAVGKRQLAEKDNPPLDFIGDDPGECFLIVDLRTHTFERLSYHQRRPDYATVSPDGKHVGLATLDGWIPPGETDSPVTTSIPPDSKTDEQQMIALRIKKGMRSLSAGTFLYSLWEISPCRPVWEMRHYKNTVEAGESAKFARPWASYARIDLPWWSEKMNPMFYKSCHISFSPNSKQFVALDECHGVHVLSIGDGHQYHCCPPVDGVIPMSFYFEKDSTILSVICSDASVRRFTLLSGEELVYEKPRIPIETEFRTIDTLLTMQFAVNSQTGILATRIAGKTLALFERDTKQTNWDILSKVEGIGETSVCRVDVSRDRNWIGIGYNRWKDGRDSAMVRRYELANLRSSKVVKRIVSIMPGERIPLPTEPDTTLISTCFAPCLSPDGADIYYAVPLNGE